MASPILNTSSLLLQEKKREVLVRLLYEQHVTPLKFSLISKLFETVRVIILLNKKKKKTNKINRAKLEKNSERGGRDMDFKTLRGLVKVLSELETRKNFRVIRSILHFPEVFQLF